jgi:hypothetical protein
MDNLNILVEAKREYMEQLCILICPAMIDVFDEMFQESTKLSKGRMVLEKFQVLLKDVKEWSQMMAKQNTDEIANRCAWFKDLVAAVFVSSVKILSAVRLSKDSKKFSMKLPTNEIFIHQCFKKAAKDLYQNPYIFTDNQTEHDRNDKLYDRFAVCVESAVKELIPVQQILQTYMTVDNNEISDQQEGNVEQDDVEEAEDEPVDEPSVAEDGIPGVETLGRPPENPMDPTGGPPGPPGPPEDPADEESYDGPAGMQEQPGQPLPPSQPSQPQLQGVPFVSSGQHFENEFRNINTNRAPNKPVENEDLFPDAPEMRQRKQ